MIANCIKCSVQYQETEEEAYLCSSCLTEKKALAAEIDRKRGNQPRVRVKSELELYEEARKVRGGFPSANSLMH